MSEATNTGRYHIGIVSKLTGISTHTIRVWERRYGAVEPQRSPGGTREYTEADIDKLIALRTLTEAGHAIGQVARMSEQELARALDTARARGLVDESAIGREASVVANFLSAIKEMDVTRAERTLVEAATVISPLSMVFDVIAPIAHQVGELWESGEFRIVDEHAATAVIRTFLGSFLSGQIKRDDAPVAVVATPSEEQHELGALMAAFVAVTRGWQVIYLGPSLPVEEIIHVVDKADAQMLLLSLVNDRSEPVVERLRELRRRLPEDVRVLAGGRAAEQYGGVFDDSELVASLRGLHRELSLRPSGAGASLP